MKYSSFYKGDFSKNSMRGLQKKGQVTIFLILGIIIVASILVFFLYVKPNYINSTGNKLYLETCVEDAIKEEIPKLSLKAGVENSRFNYNYLEENITFVCYSDEYYKPCVVQQPLLKETFERNLELNLKSAIESCYSNAVDELKSRGYEVLEGKISYDISLQPNQINISINAPTSISTDDSSRRIKNFEIILDSEIYNILMLATSIVQFETSYGDVEVSTLNFYYPNVNVEKTRREEGVKIYNIKDNKEIEFKFASRSFAWPPGYGFT